MDLDAIRLEVFKQTGINIDKADPFYAALVMLAISAKHIENVNTVAVARIDSETQAAAKRQARHLAESREDLASALAKIERATGQVMGVQEGLTTAAASQAAEVLRHIVGDINQVLDGLKKKDGLALQTLRNTEATQAQWARNVGMVIAGALVLAIILPIGGFYTGRASGAQDVTQKTEWLDTEEGGYALQLRAAGSLKALATCSPGDYKNDWKKKDNKVCLPYPTDGNVIGWRINK